MMTLDQMKKAKDEYGLSCDEISGRSGVPLGTVQKVFSGVTKSPRYKTLQALGKAFEDPAVSDHSTVTPDYSRADCSAKTAESDQAFCGVSESPVPYITEGSSAVRDTAGSGQGDKTDADLSLATYRYANHTYDRQGTYTVQDYLALPDDQRVELIDGVFYDMTAPYSTHQTIAFEAAYQIRNYIDAHDVPFQVFVSPIDVQLDRDDRTMMEPDVIVICNPEIITRERIYGAPDFIIEVLSKSTRKRDMSLKLWKYTNAGVREYWTVDPDKLKIIVHDLEHEDEITIYSFHDKVPVAIYGGELEIDFERIWKKIARFY